MPVLLKKETVQSVHPTTTLQKHNTENSKQIFPEKELCGHQGTLNDTEQRVKSPHSSSL